MNKLSIAAGLVAMGCLSVSGQALAACAGTPLTTAQVQTQIVGKTVCGARGGDRWQEFHAAGFDLIDYKKGPSDPIDPTKKVGTWMTPRTGGISYTYGPGETYTYQVYSNGGNSYSFCGTSDNIDVTVINGQGPCP